MKPWIFNLGAIAVGLVTFASVYGFIQALRLSGTNVLLTAVVCLSLICNGTSSLAAGLFPMPHPYHGAGPAQLGVLLGPALLVSAFWKRRRASGWVFWCLAACMALFAIVLVFMRPGVTGINTDPIMGLLQRILAVAGFAPLGLAAYALLKQQTNSLQVGTRRLAQPRGAVGKAWVQLASNAVAESSLLFQRVAVCTVTYRASFQPTVLYLLRLICSPPGVPSDTRLVKWRRRRPAKKLREPAIGLRFLPEKTKEWQG